MFNARSLCNKLVELHYLLCSSKFDILSIIKSWLHKGITNGLLDPERQFTVLRHDRSVTSGEGVCAFVSSSLQVTPVNLGKKYFNLELLCFDLLAPNSYFSICYFLVYRASSFFNQARSRICLLTECLKVYCSTVSSDIIAGDLNLPKIDWFYLFCVDDQVHKPFFEFAIEYGFAQIVERPTRGSNTLDIVLGDNVHAILNIAYLSPFSTSDHNAVSFFVLFEQECIDCNPESDRYHYCWYDANFDDMIDILQGINWLSIVSNYPSAEGMWSVFRDILKQIIDGTVPQRCLGARFHKKLLSVNIHGLFAKSYVKNSRL